MALMRLFLIVSSLALLSGCQSLPDIQPFTDATVGLRSAVAASGTSVVAELRQTPLAGVATEAKKLEEAWKARNDAMSALVDYANSLQAIVDSGKKGEESVQKLADAANTLAGSLGIANLAASAAGTLATDAVKYVYGQIAKARAAKSLEAALSEIQPAIEQMTKLLTLDLKNVDDILILADQAELDTLASGNQREIAYRRQLLLTRGQLMSATVEELSAGKKPAELTRADDLARISELLAKTDAWNLDYEQKQAAIKTRGRAAHELIAAANQALPDWAAAHAKLLAVVSAKRPPSVTELTDAATHIRDLVDRYRKL